MNTRTSIVAALLLLASFAANESRAQSSQPELTQVSGQLYRVQSGAEHTVFLVTADGIVLADPISADTAQWLKEELERRFPQRVVRYLVFTSHRSERASGAVIFADRAELIAHRDFRSALSAARKEAEPNYRRVRDAESYFDDTRTISIGGRTVELVHVPTALTPASAAIVFRSERIAFVAEAPPLDEATFTFGTFKPREVRRWLATVSGLEFDTLLLGNGRSIHRSQIVKLSAYVDTIVTRVASEYEAGRSADTFTEAQLQPAHRSDATFRNWRANVADAFRDVSVFTMETSIGATSNYFVRNDAFCASSTTCSTGGAVPAGIVNLSVSYGRWSVLGEVTAIEELFSARTSAFHDEDFALRETRIGAMIGHNSPAGALSMRLMGGMFYAIGDRRGIERIKGGLAPFAGRHPIESRDARSGVTGGIDLTVGRRLGLVFPLRFNYALGDAATTWPSRMDAQAGVAIKLRLYRTID